MKLQQQHQWPPSAAEEAVGEPEEVGVANRPETEEAGRQGAGHPVIATTHPATRAICTKSSGRPHGGVVTVTPVPGGTSRAPAQDTTEILLEKLK